MSTVNYSELLSGSPVVPPMMVTWYFLGFLAVLSIMFVAAHQHIKPVQIHHKVILFLSSALALKLFVAVGGSALAAYWLVPQPTVVSVSPSHGQEAVGVKEKIEIEFDRPVDRKSIEKAIYPETPGLWVYEKPGYDTHLYQKLVFYPTFSLLAGTEYRVEVSNVKNLAQVSEANEFVLSFSTVGVAQVVSVTPSDGLSEVEIDAKLEVKLDRTNDGVSQFDFEISPPVAFEAVLESGDKYVLTPRQPLAQGTEYELKIFRSNLVWDVAENQVISRNKTELLETNRFTTKEPPGVEEMSPTGANVFVDSRIKIEFSQNMDQKSVEQNFSIAPEVGGEFVWKDEKTMEFVPGKLAYETDYQIRIGKGASTSESGYLTEEVQGRFRTIGKVKVVSVFPMDGWKGVDTKDAIKINFDQEVDKSSAEGLFFINPQVAGSFAWTENSLVFTPTDGYEFSKEYRFGVIPGVKSVNGLDSGEKFEFGFASLESVTKLRVPANLQKYSLSCEVAALRMGLNYRGVEVSEDRLLDLVGYDLTPHKNSVWGNPYEAFVGNVRGRQMVDGYGVYWGPIARAGESYRKTQAFEGWQREQVLGEVLAGNPVVVWTFSKNGSPTSWFTPGGEEIFAVAGEHAVVVVGFVGSVNNPSQVIVNDPLVGQVYWSRDLFDKKWDTFSNSGVVIY